MANRKRTRYVVAYRKGEERKTVDILAYSPEGARDVAVRYGRTPVLSVRRYVKGERAEIPANGGWKLNNLNLRAAISELGLTWPVQIKQTGARGGRNGAYRPEAGPSHKITVKSWLTPEQAGATLWHELVHAVQAERLAARIGSNPRERAFILAWNAQDRGTAYLHKRREVEARAAEPNNARCALAR